MRYRMLLFAYASVFLSIVWGIPGLVMGLLALRDAKILANRSTGENRAVLQRDVRGSRMIAWTGIALSAIVLFVVLISLISNMLA